MHRKPIDCERGNKTAISCRTQLFNGFWMITNRLINCPTIACTCMRTELWFCTILILVHSVCRKILYIWHNDGAKKKSECYERIRSSDSRLCVGLLQPMSSLTSQANQSTLFKCHRHSAQSSTVGSVMLYPFIVESCTYM